MKIFISWSGDRSQAVAKTLRDWLPCVFQNVTPFFSSEDLRKGKRWLPDLAAELDSSSFGLICLDRSNMHSPWLLFEAGVLSKAIDGSYVCTLLLDGLKHTEVTGPLSHFQHTSFDKTDFRKLAGTINGALKEKKITEDVLNKVFEKFWPELESSINASMVESRFEGRPPNRTDRELVEEVLTLSRFIARNIDSTGDASREAHIVKLGKLLYYDLRKLDFPKRILKLLSRANIENVGTLVTKTPDELRHYKGVTDKDIKYLAARMEQLGLGLGLTISSNIWDES